MRKANSSNEMYRMLEDSFGEEDDAAMIELEIDNLTNKLVQKIDKAFTELRGQVVKDPSVSSVKFDRTLSRALLERVAEGLRNIRIVRDYNRLFVAGNRRSNYRQKRKERANGKRKE